MKKLINDPKSVVPEMLEGAVALAPGQTLLSGEMVVVRDFSPPASERKVALISGGGSGHEPAHAGYVGAGMLTAAVAGDVFTSPSTDAVLAAIRAVAGPAGAVLIVKNYTGDRLNFGMAAELAHAEGIPVETVVVADDVALRDTVEKGRRRGIAGTVLIHKIAGAAASQGASLDVVARTARDAARDLGSMGVALEGCTVPAVGRPGFVLGDQEIELGLGIHGEAGVRRAPIQSAAALVDVILDAIVADLGLSRGDRCVVLVNGLGGTPPMELSIVARSALNSLAERGVVVERAWTGTFLSALDMRGCSISLLRVDDQRLSLLDAPADASAWPGKGALNLRMRMVAPPRSPITSSPPAAAAHPDATYFKRAVFAAAHALLAAEERLTDLDSRAGDGDLGISMARGADAVMALPEASWRDAPTALASMGDALRRVIGGSSGPFYGVALLRAARRMGESPASPAAGADAFALAVKAVADLGGAGPGDRTMLDALLPASAALSAALSEGKTFGEALRAAADAARKGAEATAAMSPRLGRASYLGARVSGVEDGGAVACAIWLDALAEAAKP